MFKFGIKINIFLNWFFWRFRANFFFLLLFKQLTLNWISTNILIIPNKINRVLWKILFPFLFICYTLDYIPFFVFLLIIVNKALSARQKRKLNYWIIMSMRNSIHFIVIILCKSINNCWLWLSITIFQRLSITVF